MVKFLLNKECFATLVAIIFIIDAIKSTIQLKNPRKIDAKQASGLMLNSTDLMSDELLNTTKLMMAETPLEKASRESSFFFSVLLFLMTFAVCMTLKSFRDKPFLPSKVGFSLDTSNLALNAYLNLK